MLSEPAADPARAGGPPLVTAGRSGTRRILVLDPAGAAKHAELPATWRPLTEDHEVLWSRAPVRGARPEYERALTEAAHPQSRTDIVASGPLASQALDLAEERSSSVRSVLLVDPAAEGMLSPGDAAAADEDWLVQHGNQIAVLRDAGVVVEVIAHSTGEPDDQVPAPLPLGHPVVVDALRDALNHLPEVRRP